MNKELIERTVCEIGVECGFLNPIDLLEFASKFLARIDAERGKEAERKAHNAKNWCEGCTPDNCSGCGGVNSEVSTTIPEGMALVPIEPTIAMLDAYCHGLGPTSNWAYMLAAAQGERNA